MTDRPRPLRAIARLAFGNPVSRLYLGFVALAVLAMEIETRIVSPGTAPLAQDVVLIVTSPMILLCFFVGVEVYGFDAMAGHQYMYGALVIAVLVQAFALGVLARLAGRWRRRRCGRQAGRRGGAGAVSAYPWGA
jgi:hypothetical protein